MTTVEVEKPAVPSVTPRWFLWLALAGFLAPAGLVFIQIIAVGIFRNFHLISALLWACGALAIIGVIGAVVTMRIKWLWLIALAGGLVALSFLLALSRFNWGMG